MDQTKQDLRKDQILDAALTVLVQNGYEGSRMDDVVSESQLSKGAIYWYYKSKKAMYLDLVNFWVIRYSATINHLVENDQAAPDQLKSLFNYFIDQYESDPDPFIALTEFWSMAQKDDDFRAKLQKVYSQFLEVLEKIVAKGVKDGDFKNSLNQDVSDYYKGFTATITVAYDDDFDGTNSDTNKIAKLITVTITASNNEVYGFSAYKGNY